MDYDFGNRLQQLLTKNNISQRKLANMIGVTEAAVSRYINNLQKPRPDILSDIATALNTTTDYLLGKESTSVVDKEMVNKFNQLVENQRVKVLFDKIGDLNDEELDQVVNIITIIKKDDKEKK